VYWRLRSQGTFFVSFTTFALIAFIGVFTRFMFEAFWNEMLVWFALALACASSRLAEREDERGGPTGGRYPRLRDGLPGSAVRASCGSRGAIADVRE
jgi:hypothetical protein